ERERDCRLFHYLKSATFSSSGATVALDVLSMGDGCFFIGVLFPVRNMLAAQPVSLEVHGL
ncbi:hypothetical protein, partial [Desulfovibrio sp. 6_1_46AFAA]|uniref:hypothetical protein n=1 Tax=Desulfovibrio sp. 6_1_46AFAA TaxID=665942 RepID=UPI001E4B3F94